MDLGNPAAQQISDTNLADTAIGAGDKCGGVLDSHGIGAPI